MPRPSTRGNRILVAGAMALGLLALANWSWRASRALNAERRATEAAALAEEEAARASKLASSPARGKPVRAAVPTGLAAAPVEFEPGRGFFEAGMEVRLRCATPDSVIRYTTNGLEPGPATGKVYSGPIRITRTTVLRGTRQSGTGQSPVATHAYVFLRDVATSRSLGPSITASRIRFAASGRAAGARESLAGDWSHPGGGPDRRRAARAEGQPRPRASSNGWTRAVGADSGELRR
jgi:hypothetical protein